MEPKPKTVAELEQANENLRSTLDQLYDRIQEQAELLLSHREVFQLLDIDKLFRDKKERSESAEWFVCPQCKKERQLRIWGTLEEHKDVYRRLMSRSTCRACDAISGFAMNSCPEEVYDAAIGVCTLAHRHEGRCVPLIWDRARLQELLDRHKPLDVSPHGPNVEKG